MAGPLILDRGRAWHRGATSRLSEQSLETESRTERPLVLMHNRAFNKDLFYANGASARLTAITNDTGEAVGLAVRLGERLWREGFRYSNCGVLISELLPEAVQQPAWWSELDRERRERAWKTVDQLNATFRAGRHSQAWA